MVLDPFEGRLAFLEILKKLTASQQSQIKTAQFALRHKDLDEDLYNCVLEELEHSSLNSRVNIIYFLETLCDYSYRNGCNSYISMIRKDIGKIVRAVAPPGPQGAANVSAVRKVIENLKNKAYINDQDFHEIEASLSERDDKNPNTIENKAIFSKEEIFKRIEEDRERHKLLRENIWVIPEGDIDMNVELENAWETTSSLDEYDFEFMEEENMKAAMTLS
ncbi:hypothetical protein T552_01196 [Pneumocystis carinii B80]|uniref:CID domain-containing protein n=1 Tax=Pneumocystis carinii (strain B80) TaxID=1408658 RepID=A0A0W4ZLH8_PNEC8|nr:hypothetical protein T552_01196 [Pneumocystis carinii B80]KTW29240.1 hypothetical protein T552_01196 [Pneumocystis carinii B80]